MRYRRKFVAATAVLLVVLSTTTAVSAANGASTAPIAPPPVATTQHALMVISGYDADVAAANGFRIVTNPDGTQKSIAVTDAAAALLTQADNLRSAANASRQATAGSKVATPAIVSNCGDSWVSGVKQAHDTVGFHTGFLVFLAATHYSWTVNAVGLVTLNFWHTSGAGPASGTKSFEGGIPWVIGPGVGGVPYHAGAASVTLKDGTVCYSVGPTFTFN